MEPYASREDALPQGGRIAIPNDPTQGGRGLMLFAQAGAIQLPANADVRVTVADITGNPKRLRIVELEAAQLPRALDDVDAAAINTNYALTAGLQPTRDAIAIERSDSPHSNRIVVRQGDEESAERHYRTMLPVLTFIMQGIAHFVLYGKL